MKVQSSKFKVQSLMIGFTLVESLIAIAVFTVGISAAIFVITQAISVGSRVKNKITAAYLAQEGIEVVRNIRDRNWIAGRPWTDKISALSNACVQWTTDYDTIDTDKTCPPGGSGTYLVFFGTPPHYAYAVSGQFSRLVGTTLENAGSTDPNNPERLKVTSAVTCGTGCSVALEEYLYNWK